MATTARPRLTFAGSPAVSPRRPGRESPKGRDQSSKSTPLQPRSRRREPNQTCETPSEQSTFRRPTTGACESTIALATDRLDPCTSRQKASFPYRLSGSVRCVQDFDPLRAVGLNRKLPAGRLIHRVEDEPGPSARPADLVNNANPCVARRRRP